MLIKSNYVLQKTFINFYKPQFQTAQSKKSKNDEKTQKCNILGLKTPKNDLLTLNYGLPSSVTTLRT